MNINYKTLAVIIVFLSIANYTLAQEKKQLYMIADTVNIEPSSRIVEIVHEGVMTGFVFYCKCLKPYDRYLTFGFNHTLSKVPTISEKPEYKYTSWKDFREIIEKSQKDFKDQYDLFITEVLPGNRFKTEKVKLVIFTPPQHDYTIIEK